MEIKKEAEIILIEKSRLKNIDAYDIKRAISIMKTALEVAIDNGEFDYRGV